MKLTLVEKKSIYLSLGNSAPRYIINQNAKIDGVCLDKTRVPNFPRSQGVCIEFWFACILIGIVTVIVTFQILLMICLNRGSRIKDCMWLCIDQPLWMPSKLKLTSILEKLQVHKIKQSSCYTIDDRVTIRPKLLPWDGSLGQNMYTHLGEEDFSQSQYLQI